MHIIDNIYVEQNAGAGIASPQARLHIAAGTNVANTAPIKLTSGAALATVEDGAIEYHDNHLYVTVATNRGGTPVTERHIVDNGIDVNDTAASTLTLSKSSKITQIFTGSIDNQIINLGNATQYTPNHRFLIANESLSVIQINNLSGTQLYRLCPYEEVQLYIRDNSTTDGVWSIRSTSVETRKNVFRQYTDWVTYTSVGENAWLATNSGGSSAAFSVTNSNTPGVIAFTTSTLATNRASLTQGIIQMFFGGGVVVWECYVRFPTLSTAAQEYSARLGFGDNTGAGDMVDGVYFEYNRATTGAFWVGKTSRASSRATTGATSAAIVANTWYRLRIEINHDGTLVNYFVGDTLIGSLNSLVPIASANVCSLLLKLEKSVGTTAITMQIDYVDCAIYFNTERG